MTDLIRGDVRSIRFEFQTGMVQNISWISGKINIGDVLTEMDNALNDTLHMSLETTKLPIYYDNEG